MRYSNKIFIPVAIISTFIALTFWSQSTSWLYHRPFMCDSAIFQIIGKYWATGEALPYSGLFDSKGPIIFLVNAIGYALMESKMGVFILQLLFLSAATFIAFIGLRRYYGWLQSGLLASIIPFYLFTMTDEGNTVSEYLLPLLMLSFLCVEKYLNSKDTSHPYGYALVYGLTFGWCLMSRLTDCVTLGGALLAVFLILIANKQWKNLIINALSLCAGILIVVLPFVIYFGIKGHEYDFWYGTLLYNIGYVDNSLTGIHSLMDLLLFVKNYLLLIILLALSLILVFNRDTRKHGLVWLLSTVVSLIWFLRSRMSPAYAIVTLPYIYVIFVEVKFFFLENKFKRYSYKAVCGFVVFLLLMNFSKEVFDLNRSLKEINPSYWSDRKLIEMVPGSDRDAFIADDWSPQNYVYENIKPCYTYFTLQDFQTKMSPSLKSKVMASFGTLQAKWILVSDYSHTMIRPILDKYYVKFAAKNGKVLVKRKLN